MEAIYLVCGARRPQLKRNPLGCIQGPMNTPPSVVAALLLTSLGIGFACGSAPAQIREISGCYAVTVGAWVVDPRNPIRPQVPPDTIRLTTTRVTDTSTTRFQVQPDVFFIHTLGGNWARSGDTIIIAWSTGFDGVGMRLTRGDSGLTGTVRYWTDVIVTDENGEVPSPSAPVRLVRSRCFTPDAA